MTYKEACERLGYEKPPKLKKSSRELVVETVEEFSKNGTQPIDSQTARRIRSEIDEFG